MANLSPVLNPCLLSAAAIVPDAIVKLAKSRAFADSRNRGLFRIISSSPSEGVAIDHVDSPCLRHLLPAREERFDGGTRRWFTGCRIIMIDD